ncbi:hypothetical protein VULLAG_LOCUS11880 [Vulpes lagopus]
MDGTHSWFYAAELRLRSESMEKLKSNMSSGLFMNQKLLKRPFLACPGSLGLPEWQDPNQYPSAAVGTVKRLMQNMKSLQTEQGPCVIWIRSPDEHCDLPLCSPLCSEMTR